MSHRWSPENEAILCRLWATGLSANAIAKQLGVGFTRNSVIGKAARLGLAVAKRPEKDRNDASPAVLRIKAEGKVPHTKTAATDRAIGSKRGRKGNAVARLARRKEERETWKRAAVENVSRKAVARRAAVERARRLAAVKKRHADARIALNRKLSAAASHDCRSVPAASAAPPFEALRTRWVAAVMYLHRFEHRAPDADDVVATKRLIDEIELEWVRLISVPRGHPDFFEWPSTDPRLGDGKIDAQEWEVQGMLGYLGYHVGRTSDLTPGQRRLLLSRVFSTHLPPINNLSYMRGWGPPGSAPRLQKMAESLAAFVRLRKQRRDTFFHEAIHHWEDDLRFLYKRYYVGKFRFAWPSV